MKTSSVIRWAALLLWVFCFNSSFASFGGGSVMGRVMDTSSNTPVSAATVVFDCQGNEHVFVTNDQGFYYASNIPPGVYSITVGYMSKTISVIGYNVAADAPTELNFNLELAVNAVGGKGDTTGVIIVAEKSRKPKLIDPFDPVNSTIDKGEIQKTPVVDIGQLTAIQPGITEIGGNFYVHGARADGLVYYIDQCRVMGSPDIPLCGIETYRSYTGFIPVKYGDTTGGVIVMETRSYFTEGR